MKQKLLQGMIKDLMKYPMKGMDHGAHEHEPDAHVTVVAVGKPKSSAMAPDVDEPDADDDLEGPMDPEQAKKLAMSKAIHAKHKGV